MVCGAVGTGFVPAEVSFLIMAALVTQTVFFICGV